MNIKVVAEPEMSGWKPVKLELTINSVEEARLLYHCFNRVALLDCIFRDYYGDDEVYQSSCTLLNFKNGENEVLEKIITNQGFEV